MKQAVILAGGKGTRLKGVLDNKPKPLAEVGGIPLLGHHLNLLKKYNFDEVLVLVDYEGEQIRGWIQNHPIIGLKVECIDDKVARGTGGAVLWAFERLASEFLVTYADTMINIDIDLFYQAHKLHPRSAATIFLHPNDHPFDSDLVEIDETGRILQFHSYPHPENSWLPNLVNAALYYIRKEFIRPWRKPENEIDFAKSLFPAMLNEGLRLEGYISPEYIKDAGTPQRLEKVRVAWSAGVVERASLKKEQRAVFIDRDGTINKEVGHLNKAEQLEVFPFVGPALKRLNDNEFRAILITNQPVIARGEVTNDEMRRIHARLDSELAKSGAYLDRIYVCPHHPDSGFPGERLELKINCMCRKPEAGLIFQAKDDINVNLLDSWFIGDSTRDLGAALNADVSCILVQTGNGGLDDKYPYEPAFTAIDFSKAVEFILDIYPKISLKINSIVQQISFGEDWFVSGLSRSGKTTVANSISRELKKRGLRAVVINLDRWICPEAMRSEGILGRYDVAAIEQAIKIVSSRRISPQSLKLPAYSRLKRDRARDKLTIVVDSKDIIIWEGVIAGYLALQNDHQTRLIYLETDEKKRKSRFLDYNFSRGRSKELSLFDWDKREFDEHPFILQSKTSSNYLINLDEVME